MTSFSQTSSCLEELTPSGYWNISTYIIRFSNLFLERYFQAILTNFPLNFFYNYWTFGPPDMKVPPIFILVAYYINLILIMLLKIWDNKETPYLVTMPVFIAITSKNHRFGKSKWDEDGEIFNFNKPKHQLQMILKCLNRQLSLSLRCFSPLLLRRGDQINATFKERKNLFVQTYKYIYKKKSNKLSH